MPDFALHPTQTRAPVAALFVQGANQRNLHTKLRARATHYTGMSLAVGDGWTVLFADDNAAQPSLPWQADSPVFLYRLGPHCLCELGYHPNVPTPLMNRFIAKLRQTYNASGTVALMSGQPKARLFDLSQARSLTQIDPAALS